MREQIVDNPGASAPMDNEQTVGPPPGEPTGHPQTVDISSNAGEPPDPASDESSEYKCKRCPQHLKARLLKVFGQSHEYLEVKHVTLSHILPSDYDLQYDDTVDWSRYCDEVTMLVMRGPQ